MLDKTQGVRSINHRKSAGWRIEDIDFTAIDQRLAIENEAILLLLVASSFIESGTHVYASNLVAHFDGDPAVSSWLAEHWEPEELQHGLALRTYVACVWPTFDWDRAYAGFMQAYRPLCAPGKLEPRRGLEMAARCVVETGTTTLYRALHDRVHEPVLRTLLLRIGEDEVGHYKHFYRYFLKYQQQDPGSRIAVFGALIRRSAEISREDTRIGLRHAYAERCLDKHTTHPSFDELQGAVRAILRTTVPVGLAAAMWLRPLQLAPRVERQARRIITVAARAAMVCLA